MGYLDTTGGTIADVVAATGGTLSKFLEEYGLRVIRIPNTEIHDNFDGVCSHIEKLVKESLE